VDVANGVGVIVGVEVNVGVVVARNGNLVTLLHAMDDTNRISIVNKTMDNAFFVFISASF
jgi:hypothetical protein